MAEAKWVPRQRNYAHERRGRDLPREETTAHPLKAITITMTEGKVRKLGGGSGGSSRSGSLTGGVLGGVGARSVLDPLSAALEGSDPLSQMAAQSAAQSVSMAMDPLSQMALSSSVTDPLSRMSITKKSAVSTPGGPEGLDDTFEPWSVKKSAILSKYTTSEKLSITTSFLSAGDAKDKGLQKQAQQGNMTEKVKNRLEQLDDFEEGSIKEMLNLSQQEYVNRIDELNNQLIIAWDQDQRVKALKIAIQCAKLLADVSVIQFYPSKFVLVTDILDTFGHLVFDRIKSKAQYIPKGSSVPVSLGDDFTPEQVPETAKETCRNWFFKIASIRELVPRFYVETAILRCYSFLTSGEYNAALRRLGVMARGVGDPLVSVYSRCYLCRVGIKVAPRIRDHLMPCFDDFLQSYTQIQGDSVQNLLAVQKLELPRYLTLYSPALDWILQCLAHQSSENVLVTVLEKARSKCNSALLLNSIMSAFKPEYIASRALEFTDMIKQCEETGFPKYLLYRSLGTCLVMADPPEDQKLNVLNEVWKIVVKLRHPKEYITCAEVWIEYVVKHFSKREVNTIIGDVTKHMTPDRAYEDFYPQLQSVVSKVLVHIKDFSMLFSMDKFLPFIDMFQKDSVKVEVCKNITESYVKTQLEPTSDPVVTNALMFICKTMHDSVNALTLEDEIRSIGQLIIGFIRTVSFGRDFEQQLSFYVEARASFSNIDQTIVYLVQSVSRLAMETRRIVKGNHSRKTASFVRACAAFCFITIPSLNGILSRLGLYLSCGQVALLNNCLTQGDAFFKAAVSLLPEVPRTMEVDGKSRSSEPIIIDYISNFTSTLLVVPDNPEQEVLYLVRGLLNVLNGYPWDPNSDTRTIIYMNMLVMLSAMSQDQFLYHMDKVDSNDAMYGHDRKFLQEVHGISGTLLEQVLSHVTSLDRPETYKRKSNLCLDLFNRLVGHGDLENDLVMTLAVRMWMEAQKHGLVDTKLMVRSLDYVKRRSVTSPQGKQLTQLVTKMPLQTRT